MSLTSVTSQSIDESSRQFTPASQSQPRIHIAPYLSCAPTQARPKASPAKAPRAYTLNLPKRVQSVHSSRTAIQPEKDIRSDPSSANTAVHVSLSSRNLQFSKNPANPKARRPAKSPFQGTPPQKHHPILSKLVRPSSKGAKPSRERQIPEVAPRNIPAAQSTQTQKPAAPPPSSMSGL